MYNEGGVCRKRIYVYYIGVINEVGVGLQLPILCIQAWDMYSL